MKKELPGASHTAIPRGRSNTLLFFWRVRSGGTQKVTKAGETSCCSWRMVLLLASFEVSSWCTSTLRSMHCCFASGWVTWSSPLKSLNKSTLILLMHQPPFEPEIPFKSCNCRCTAYQQLSEAFSISVTTSSINSRCTGSGWSMLLPTEVITVQRMVFPWFFLGFSGWMDDPIRSIATLKFAILRRVTIPVRLTEPMTSWHPMVFLIICPLVDWFRRAYTSPSIGNLRCGPL